MTKSSLWFSGRSGLCHAVSGVGFNFGWWRYGPVWQTFITDVLTLYNHNPLVHKITHIVSNSTLMLQCQSPSSFSQQKWITMWPNRDCLSFWLTSATPFSGISSPIPLTPSVRAWLRRPIRRRCQCFALWDVVSMVTPAPTACAPSATRNTCRDNREGDDPAPQERKVGRWERRDL